jgi:DNA-binding NarL/FixJ family response regulator
MTLLLIDDNELVRNSLAGLLNDMYPDLEIRSFSRCEPALLERDVQVDFVLLDFHLIGRVSALGGDGLVRSAELDGWACLQAMIAQFPKAKVVLMSANRKEEMTARARALGAHGFVEKSVQSSVLLYDLRRAFDA